VSWSIRRTGPDDIEAARLLLQANGWDGAHFEPAGFALLVARAHEALVAVQDDVVVGFARSVGDGVSNGYICTLVVAEGHRKRGIARGLVARLMGDDPDMTWVLRAGRADLFAFYEKLGFKRSEVTMERLRRPGARHQDSR
jgi:ribosomal protein S18 acetylase RimI-like enzyme